MNDHTASPFCPSRGPRLAGLIAAGLFVAGCLAALVYGLTRADPALRWPSVAGVLAFIVAPVCLLILVLAALRERRPPARLTLSLPAVLLALLMMGLAALSPAEAGGLNLLCLGPLALLLAMLPLLAARQTPEYLRQERERARGQRLLAHLTAQGGLLRYRDAARALGWAEVTVRTQLADLEAAGDLAGRDYPEAGLYVSAPAEEAGVARIEALLTAGAPRDAAALAAQLAVPAAVAADWLALARG